MTDRDNFFLLMCHGNFVKTSCKNLMRMVNSYLTDIDKQAEEMFILLVKELAENENVTEQLKAENQMLWMHQMNNIHNRVMEIINTDLIYV